MKKAIVIVLSIVLFIGILVGVFYIRNYKAIQLKRRLGKWEAATSDRNGQLPWISIIWSTDSIGNKMAMFVPVKIENLPNQFRFQFDIGANLSMVYGNTLRPFSEHYANLQKRLNSVVFAKDTLEYLSELHLVIDGISYSSPAVAVRTGFGEVPPPDSVLAHNSTCIVGTIGADICQKKVLIIDYPRNRLCIVDSVPAAYRTAWSDIILDFEGRPVLKMEYKGKDYKIQFDCGSSIFPILTSQKLIGEFSTAPSTDTIGISSWGVNANVIARPMKDSFTLAGHKFGNTKVYAFEDASKENLPRGCDGITGNVLFMDKVLIIDFKNRKLGIK